jgi:ArsR family transcriptional regulator
MRDSFAELVPVFKALADETRLRIIDLLGSGERCACDLLADFTFSQPTLSYHMKILTESGLVSGRRDGAWMRYSLNAEKFAEVKALWAELGSRHEVKSGTCDCSVPNGSSGNSVSKK